MKQVEKIQHNLYIEKLYVTFFKKVCEKISESVKMRKKLIDIDELYHFNLKNKIFKTFKKFVNNIQIQRGIFYRKRITWILFFNNLKFIKDYNIKKCDFYRKLHLKKYFIKRWKRTMIKLKNIKIAKLKFISKFILLWRKVIMKDKKNKIYSIYMLENVVDKLNQKYVN